MMRAVKPADENAQPADVATLEPADQDVRPADAAADAAAVATATEPAGHGAEPAGLGGGPAGRDAPRAILRAAILGMAATAAVLSGMAATAGLTVTGWIAGLATGCAAAALIAAARTRSDTPSLHPADWVTLTRAVLIAGVAGLVADSFSRPVAVTPLVTLSIVALVLDAVDGQVARRTGTATPLGGRLDGEVDAFLILLLSIVVSRDFGGWVLAIGAIRYAFLVAGWLVPWLAAPLPPRFWRKVVAAVQGVVLTAAASGVPSRLIVTVAVAAALLLLAESFGRDVLWLYRAGAGPRVRLAVRITIFVLALALLWFDLLAPDRTWDFSLAAFARIPVEVLVLVALALVLPPRPRRIAAGAGGILVGLLTIDKILNIVFFLELNRPFNPVDDWVSIRPAEGVIRDAIGTTLTNIALAVVGIILILLIGAITASAVHVTTVAARNRRGAFYGLAAVTAVWGLSTALSLQFVPGSPVASTSATGLAISQVRATQFALSDPRRFEQAINSPDPQASVPASDLLTGLRGKDVIIAVVESYGQVAVQGSSFSPGVDAVLRQRTSALARAGWSTQSAWLKSSTFGGISWLAHSTVQSGLWVDSTQRYAQLVASQRFTLSDAFHKAGWHTVADDPTDGPVWLPGKQFYHYDRLYNRSNVGYQGPKFSYSPMPDQYVLSRFQRDELAPGHKPVMAEIDLTSSHVPWAPLPHMVPWDKVGDGSVFDAQPAQSESVSQVWRDNSTVKQFYGKSIQYSLTALTSWVTELNDPNLVLILYGDHQPHTAITGGGASHDIPISIVTRDPSVLRKISSWHWQDGLLPGPGAPLRPMDAFRNQFLDTFNKAPAR
jgi:phosphatidylglycerophosphate synthase